MTYLFPKGENLVALGKVKEIFSTPLGYLGSDSDSGVQGLAESFHRFSSSFYYDLLFFPIWS